MEPLLKEIEARPEVRLVPEQYRAFAVVTGEYRFVDEEVFVAGRVKIGPRTAAAFRWSAPAAGAEFQSLRSTVQLAFLDALFNEGCIESFEPIIQAAVPTAPVPPPLPPPAAKATTWGAVGTNVTVRESPSAPSLLPAQPSEAPVALPRRGDFIVESLRPRSKSSDLDWIGQAFVEAVHRDWEQRGLLAPDLPSAKYVLLGEYWVKRDRVYISASLMKGLRKVVFLQWEADNRQENLLALIEGAKGDLMRVLHDKGLLKE